MACETRHDATETLIVSIIIHNQLNSKNAIQSTMNYIRAQLFSLSLSLTLSPVTVNFLFYCRIDR